MEAKELMIGDWVIHRGKQKKIVYIYCRPLHNGTNPANDIAFTHDQEEWIDASWAEPILLTEDILVANGFELCKQPNNNWWINDKFEIQCIDGHLMQYMFDCDIELKYVHELQHALRLCGLNELADNFKIK